MNNIVEIIYDKDEQGNTQRMLALSANDITSVEQTIDGADIKIIRDGCDDIFVVDEDYDSVIQKIKNARNRW